MFYREALNLAMDEIMEEDSSVVILGEDVGFYGGNYRVTEGLYAKYGEKRVIDTPIAENSIVGVAIGMALGGLRPIAEIMTANFAMLAMDQIVNNMAKLRYMSGGKIVLPMVVRMPQGVVKQLASQHSQSLESLFASIPGLRVFTASDCITAYHGLKTAIKLDDPVIFLEHTLLYFEKFDLPKDSYYNPFKARVLKEGKDITIFSYLKMVHDVLKVVDKIEKTLNVSAEVIDVGSLNPLDLETLTNSVKKTKRFVVVEENPKHGGFGAHIVSSVLEECFYNLDAPPLRIAGEDVPIPYNRKLELLAIPTPEKIYSKIVEWGKQNGL
ncbi:alpha-ketoacid dehydrogenase subunit beta [Sulfurihydrogenibium subterraneum]|uniref:alpha-ketoacid dehydrogenase subunit beta n=1 Tax=Sulfurihydrogenibium subterraneum TaxID=171121 RepID=UPI00048EE21A|nr:alpha-ketoacid dehydrogenase subunit beta [Sulfurihydrogenibium subterraneum]